MNNKTTKHNSGASDSARFFVPGFRQRETGRFLTKSYKPLKQRYFIKQPNSRAKLPLFSGSHPNYSNYSGRWLSATVRNPYGDASRFL
jgi:hypothetical protein